MPVNVGNILFQFENWFTFTTIIHVTCKYFFIVLLDYSLKYQ